MSDSTPREITLFTKPGCHLCEKADELIRQTLERLGSTNVTYRQVDISRDPALLEAYGERIPVIAVDGTPSLFGQVSRFRLEELLRGRGLSRRYLAFLRRMAGK